MTAPLGLDDRLRVYVEASKRQFILARDASGAAVESMTALAGGVTPDLLDAALARLAEAGHAVRLMAATLEENRRMLAETQREMDGTSDGGIQPENH